MGLCSAMSTAGGRLAAGDRQAGRSAAHLNPATIARIIKDRCAAANLTPEIFSGHSLRRGFVTSARAAGADWSDIRRQTRHKSVIVAEGYETAEVWGRNHPASGSGCSDSFIRTGSGAAHYIDAAPFGQRGRGRKVFCDPLLLRWVVLACVKLAYFRALLGSAWSSPYRWSR